MSAAAFVSTCQVCGAEESLDGLLGRLIADVISMSLPLGKDVLRYLRLHKPAKQRLRMSTVRKVLAELVPDMQRSAIERHGRAWAMTNDSWKAALQAVFDNAERGALTLPLDGNGYLYAVITRMADRAEADAEKAHEDALRGRAHQGGSVDIGTALGAGQPAPAGAAPARKDPVLAAMEERDRQAAPMPAHIREQIAAMRGKKGNQ